MTTYAQRKKPESTGEKSAEDGLDRRFAASASSLNLPNSTLAAQEHHLKSNPLKPVCPAQRLLIFSLMNENKYHHIRTLQKRRK